MDCLFCKILKQEIPASFVFEDHLCLAFRDIQPQAPTHVLIIPKKHFLNVKELEQEDVPLIGHLHMVAKKIAETEGLLAFRLVMNNGAEVGQSVGHLHLHLLGGRAFGWPPG